jgi:hypothetical protein
MKVRVKFKACDRCPIGKQEPATETLRLTLGEASWDIDLCFKHVLELERVVEGWGRLGQTVERTQSSLRLFGEEYTAQQRRTAQQRSQQAEQDRAVATSIDKRTLASPRVVELPKGAPLDGGQYEFTVHARERLVERNVKVVDVLWAASSPEIVTAGDRPGTEVRIRRGTRVVINPKTNEILTVALTESD